MKPKLCWHHYAKCGVLFFGRDNYLYADYTEIRTRCDLCDIEFWEGYDAMMARAFDVSFDDSMTDYDTSMMER